MGYSLYIKCKSKQEQLEIYEQLVVAFENIDIDIHCDDYDNMVGFMISAGTIFYETLCLICLMKLAKKYNNDLYFDEDKIELPDQKYLINYKTFFTYSISDINGKLPFSMRIMRFFNYLARGKKFLKEADTIINKFN